MLFALVEPTAAPDVAISIDTQRAARGDLGILRTLALQKVLKKRVKLYWRATRIAEDLCLRSVWTVTGRKHILEPTESEVKFAKTSKTIEELGFLTPGDVGRWDEMELRLARLCVEGSIDVTTFDSAVKARFPAKGKGKMWRRT